MSAIKQNRPEQFAMFHNPDLFALTCGPGKITIFETFLKFFTAALIITLLVKLKLAN